LIEGTGDRKLEDMVHKGTTTVSIVCKDGVIFGADTRAVEGYFVASKHAKKVLKIDEHIAMTIAGGVADAQNVVEILKANASLFHLENGRPIMVKAAARLTANLLFQYRGAFLIQALIGGIDESGTRIFAIDPLGSVIEETCASTGSGSPVAYGVLEEGYHKDMTVKAGTLLVVNAIMAAINRNIATGDSFDIVIIDKDGYHELTEDEKKKIQAEITA
jgi:proteasome beta subunit